MSDTPRMDVAWLQGPYTMGKEGEKLERELNAAEEYIKRLLSAGNHIADVSTDRRRLLWLDAVNSRKAKQ